MIEAVLGFGSASLWDMKVTKRLRNKALAHQVVYRKWKDILLDIGGRRS
jgi:hypothetical protein